jgi:hypothetical protein
MAINLTLEENRWVTAAFLRYQGNDPDEDALNQLMSDLQKVWKAMRFRHADSCASRLDGRG